MHQQVFELKAILRKMSVLCLLNDGLKARCKFQIKCLHASASYYAMIRGFERQEQRKRSVLR